MRALIYEALLSEGVDTAMRHLNIQNISILLFVMSLALGALTILFTPDMAEANCTCADRSGNILGTVLGDCEGTYGIKNCAVCRYPLTIKLNCKCWTGCQLYSPPPLAVVDIRFGLVRDVGMLGLSGVTSLNVIENTITLISVIWFADLPPLN